MILNKCITIKQEVIEMSDQSRVNHRMINNRHRFRLKIMDGVRVKLLAGILTAILAVLPAAGLMPAGAVQAAAPDAGQTEEDNVLRSGRQIKGSGSPKRRRSS